MGNRKPLYRIRWAVGSVLAMLLVLTGCVSNAPILSEALSKGTEVTAYESKSLLTVDTNLPVQDEQTKRVLQTLKSGVIIMEQQKDLQHAHAEVTLKGPGPILETGLWPGTKAPALDLYLQGNDIFAKTSADNKFLGIHNDSAASPDEMSEQLKTLVEQLIKQNPLTLRHVDIVGSETVDLPDGSSEPATHVRISMDFKEMVDAVTVFLEKLSQTPDLDRQLTDILGETVPPEALEPGAGLNEELAKLVEELKTVNVEELKSTGWDVDLALDVWINADKRIDQFDAAVGVKIPASLVSEAGLSAPQGLTFVDFNVKLHRQTWNVNQTITYPVPPADQVITTEQLEEDPSLAAEFGEASVIGPIASMMTMPPEEPFADLSEEHWAYEPVSALRSTGIVTGYENNEFRPNQAVTRSEYIAMTVKALGLESDGKELEFADRSDIPAWSEAYWQAAVEAGIVKGYADGTLKPNRKVTRSEMTAIFVRGMQEPLQNDNPLSFKDSSRIPSWAVPYVKTAAAKGLIHGTPDNRFAPQQYASRAEVASLLYNFMFGEM
ncbi:S-layer homology domain-containing protein [Paenibacillus humicola]|uniref:S-layer homology domain-containing protein n=1 Tax=Paenibacillus humicola TaxID=3110540 RepID=UPI00237B9A56|nr:S-layer homology domain-containing protein [Paenibacillus humicola]